MTDERLRMIQGIQDALTRFEQELLDLNNRLPRGRIPLVNPFVDLLLFGELAHDVELAAYSVMDVDTPPELADEITKTLSRMWSLRIGGYDLAELIGFATTAADN